MNHSAVQVIAVAFGILVFDTIILLFIAAQVNNIRRMRVLWITGNRERLYSAILERTGGIDDTSTSIKTGDGGSGIPDLNPAVPSA